MRAPFDLNRLSDNRIIQSGSHKDRNLRRKLSLPKKTSANLDSDYLHSTGSTPDIPQQPYQDKLLKVTNTSIEISYNM